MTPFLWYYARRRLRSSVVLAAALAVLAGLTLALFPSLSEGIDLDTYVESLPPAFREAFGIAALGTVEGFLATELYAFGWVLLLGLYTAYSAAGSVAGDVESGRMDTLLAMPVGRGRLLLETYGALLVPILVVNVVGAVAVWVGVAAVGETLSAVDLLLVHAASVPYLLCTGAVGLLASVWFDRADTARRVAAGGVFALYLVESLVANSEFAALGAVSPTRYYDPTAILVDSQYDPLGTGVLLVATGVLLAASTTLFRRKDVQ